MNANRKADLQRKLALAPVAKPPAGLAERIKTEIPKELRFNAERERERFSRSVRFSMSVAASVIVVISAAYVALHMVSREPTISPGRVRRSEPVVQRPVAAQVPAAPPPAVAEERRDLQQKKPAKLASRREKEKGQLQSQPVTTAEPQVNAMAKVPAGVSAVAAAPSLAMDRAEKVVALQVEMTTSPISKKAMVREGKNVYDAPAKTDLNLVAWKDASRETKIEILKAELARGADPEAVARAARDAGLIEFADSIQKQH